VHISHFNEAIKAAGWPGKKDSNFTALPQAADLQIARSSSLGTETIRQLPVMRQTKVA
jgi:hypothetical protein